MLKSDSAVSVAPLALTADKSPKATSTGFVDCVIFALGGLALSLMLIHQGLLPAAMQLATLQ